MDKDKFSNFLLIRNYEEVELALKNGFDPNTPLEQDKTAIEWCSYSNDYRMIEILWNYGGKATTPWTEEIINEFKNGNTYKFFTKEDEQKLLDLTESFSVDSFEFLKGKIDFDNPYYSIEIPIAEFILDNQKVKTSIRLDCITLHDKLEALIGKTVNFPINPEKGYIDGSIYLRDYHNPVDVTKLTFNKIKNGIVKVEILADFIFDFENIGFPNENKMIEVELTLGNI